MEKIEDLIVLPGFPHDFMFELTKPEWENLRSQIVTSSWGGIRYQPYVFTEQGVAMLSGILRSAHAIQVNIAIMRAFVQLRLFLESNMEFARKLDELEKAVAGHDEKIGMIFQAIRQMIGKNEEPLPPRTRLMTSPRPSPWRGGGSLSEFVKDIV